MKMPRLASITLFTAALLCPGKLLPQSGPPATLDAFVTFALKPDGAIDHFTMVAVSPLADFRFAYQDLNFCPAHAAAKEGK